MNIPDSRATSSCGCSLSSGTWSNSPSGSTNPVTVPATQPARFYRLFKP